MTTIYDHLPLLEQQWQGMTTTQRGALQQSAAWYDHCLVATRGPVCELACGYGRLLLPLAQRGLPVYGCDASPARLAAARQVFVAAGVGDWEFEPCGLPAVPARTGFHAVILALNAIGYVRTAAARRQLLRGDRRDAGTGGPTAARFPPRHAAHAPAAALARPAWRRG